MLGEELMRVHEAAAVVPRFSERYPGLTPEAGYAGARALHAHRVAHGWKPLGRKIGFTNRTLWERYGVHEPMWGTVYDRTLLFSEDGSCEVPLAGLVQPRIEPEICFKLKRAPGAGRLAECIEWMAHSVEIVQCRHPGWKVTIADCTTDNGLHGLLVVGAPRPPEDLEGLSRARASLYKGDRRVDQGSGANVLGGPLLSLSHLVELLDRQGAEPLRAGEIVTTGVLTDAHPVAPGETWRTEVSGFEGLSLVFA